VNPGETIDYGAWVKNVGTSTAQGIYGLLSTVNTYVSISTDSSYYGNINSGDSAYTNPEYVFSVANNCPNGQAVTFDFDFHDLNDSVFTSYTTFAVYAPVLVYEHATVMDGNGFLEPGETSDMMITLGNIGDAIADNVSGILSINSSYVTVVDSIGSFGSITPGDTANNNANPYTITASASTPLGTVADFEIALTSGVYTDTITFSLTVGKKHYYIWNPDMTSTPGQNFHSILGNLGYIGDHDTTFTSDLSAYQSLFICLGVNPNNYFISSGTSEAMAIQNFVENGGRAYLEGGDVWFNDPLYGGHNFGPLFGISPAGNGMNNLGPLAGESGTFTQGMYFQYSGENNSMDYIMPSVSGYVILRDDDNNYNCGIANDAGTYKTVGTNFELGLLDDNLPPSTRAVLLDSIMQFFGIMPTGILGERKITNLPPLTRMNTVYPNPGKQPVIQYQISGRMQTRLAVYDACGRLVRILADGIMEPGYFSFTWDSHDDAGRKVPAGVYFVKLETTDYSKVEKAVILR
ncbi:MAG: FlgD immunoglobulin-like domain containing protein, partial [bacterium]